MAQVSNTNLTKEKPYNYQPFFPKSETMIGNSDPPSFIDVSNIKLIAKSSSLFRNQTRNCYPYDINNEMVRRIYHVFY